MKHFFFAALLFTTPALADDWSDWRDNFSRVMTACVAAKDEACLSKAFSDRAIPAPEGDGVADLLARDLRVASVLLHQKDARQVLSRQFGIDPKAYLGTGYSVPVEGDTAGQYDTVQQREYFVPNVCAQIVAAGGCPVRSRLAWTWRLTSAQFARALDQKIGTLLKARRPDHNARGFARLAAGTDDDWPMPRLLIRFGVVPLKFYKGQLGRPEADKVFFAEYRQVRDQTLRDAMTATGAATLLEHPDPANGYFIWAFTPGDDVTPASWRALFTFLKRN